MIIENRKIIVPKIKKKFNLNDFIPKIFINGIFSIAAICCVIPVLTVAAIAFSKEELISSNGFSIIPQGFTLEAFNMIFNNPKQIITGYMVSITVTVVGATLGLLISAMIAYPLSRSDFKFKGIISFVVFFTMLFNGGLVPFYILMVNYLKVKNSILALILPLIINPFFILILRTFMKSIPLSLVESAKIDGASELRIFASIIIPLAKSGLATVGLFLAFGYWNDWFNALLFIDNNNLVPLQLMLYRMVSNIDFLISNMTNLPPGLDISRMPKITARMAMCVLAAGPMLIVFPFFQKYFVKGLTIGAIK